MANRFRDMKITIWVTEEERLRLIEKASVANISMSEYIRQMIELGMIVHVDTDSIRDLSNEINKIGVNINQVAHAVNAKGGIAVANEVYQLQDDFMKLTSLIYNKIWGV